MSQRGEKEATSVAGLRCLQGAIRYLCYSTPAYNPDAVTLLESLQVQTMYQIALDAYESGRRDWAEPRRQTQ